MLWNVLERILHWTLRIATFSTVEIINEGGMLELAGSEPLVLAANHQSHTDTSILFHAVPNSRREQMRIVASEIRFRPAELNASWRERLERWFMHGVAVHVYSAIFVGGEVGRIRSIDVITSSPMVRDLISRSPSESIRASTRLMASSTLSVGTGRLCSARMKPVRIFSRS